MKIAMYLVGAFGLMLVMAVLIAWPVQFLWNDIAPDLFGLKRISFGQALELSILCGLLFKSSSSSSKD